MLVYQHWPHKLYQKKYPSMTLHPVKLLERLLKILQAIPVLQAGSTTGKIAEASDTGAKRPRGRPCTTQSIIALLARDVPWRAVVSCVLPLLGACLGTWLLFQDFQTALGARWDVLSCNCTHTMLGSSCMHLPSKASLQNTTSAMYSVQF